MALKTLLIAQHVLYAIVICFLAYLGNEEFDLYMSLITLIYIITTAIASPLPKRLKAIHRGLTAILLTIFFYFVSLRIYRVLIS